jgi:ABC-type antimicrobial peptide transport system permease subunit
VIVNEILARRYWPGRDPVGSRVRIGAGCENGQGTSAEIVGVVKDALYASPEKAGQPYIFFPFEQRFAGYIALLVRTEHDPMQYAAVLRKELRELDDRVRIYDIDALSDEMDKSLWQVRSEASMLGAFGVLALLVATVGLYGVVAFGVRQRTQEFGIRMALGAERHDVLGLVISDVLALTLGGVGLGLFASVALTRLLRGFLYGLSPTDSATFVAVALVWTTVAVFASCVPAYHATKVDPLVALRYE